MKNQKLVIGILAGCLVVLCLCVVAAGAAWFVLDVPSKFTEISQSLGGEQSKPSPIAPFPTSAGARVTPGAPSVPTKASGSSGQPPVAPPPSGASSGNPFTDFLNKTKTATKYRVEFAWTFGNTEQGKYQEVSFFNMTGMVDGQKSYFTSKGGLMAMLGGDQNATIEFIEADGKSYMKGITLFGMTDPKQWYVTDDKSTSSFKDFARPDEFKNFTGGKDSDFKKVRTEPLDGQLCDVWLYDFKNVQNAALTSALAMSKDKGDFSAIDMGQSAVWLCGDGFVHQWTFEVRGHDVKNPNEKGALLMKAHMWDFNNPTIVVTAPANAKPMPK
ncbi:MAG: hypothetical protein FJ009_06965 [Chloroflexi bacterium]|nr:hypothetical protein [Chloroflexota bacterium]